MLQALTTEMASRHRPSSSASTRPPCRFHNTTGCKFGDACTFSHSRTGERPLCLFFSRPAGCRYGKSCALRHARPDEAEAVDADDSDTSHGAAAALPAAVQVDDGTVRLLELTCPRPAPYIVTALTLCAVRLAIRQVYYNRSGEIIPYSQLREHEELR